MRVLAAIRQLLLSLAVLGLLFAPTTGSAHRVMGPAPMMDMAHHAPDCPENPINDCPRCALTASCAFHCIDILAVEPAFAVSFEHGPAPIVPDALQIIAGIDHPPELKPPCA